MEEKDREIWIGENRLLLGEDNMLCETVFVNIDEKMAIAMGAASHKIKSTVEGKVNVPININKAGKPSPEARKIAKKRMEDEGIGKVAITGMNPVARVIASFIMGALTKADMQFFKIKEDALAWLKGESS